MKDYEHGALVHAETRPAWSAVTSELSRVPPLLLLLLTNLTLIAASSIFWSGRRADAALNSGKMKNETGLLQRVLGAAMPRLYAVVAAAITVAGAVWQDVAVLAFVRLSSVAASEHPLQVPGLGRIPERISVHTALIHTYELHIMRPAMLPSPVIPQFVQFPLYHTIPIVLPLDRS